MRLKFDGKVPEYHPATGLQFTPGEAEYPDVHAAALLATGRFHKALPPREKHDAGDKGKE